VLAFKLRNTGADTATARFCVLADLKIDDNEQPPVTEIEPQRGFTVSSWTDALSFVLRDYPFVDDVSAFYFGSFFDVEYHLWAQVAAGLSEESDLVVFSWQDITLTPGAERTFRPSLGRACLTIRRSRSALPSHTCRTECSQ
jgi:hypothetical protein